MLTEKKLQSSDFYIIPAIADCTCRRGVVGVVPVKMCDVIGESVESEEGVGVAGGAVTDAVALLQKAPLPHTLATGQRRLLELLVPVHLNNERTLSTMY